MMFSFFDDRGYNISLINRFLAAEMSFSLDEFKDEYEYGKEYFFIAYKKKDDAETY